RAGGRRPFPSDGAQLGARAHGQGQHLPAPRHRARAQRRGAAAVIGRADGGVRGAREPAMALLHPVTLLSLVVLVLNDHWLKRVAPSVLSGKLSDFAGLVLAPLVLHASYEGLSVARGKPAARG